MWGVPRLVDKASFLLYISLARWVDGRPAYAGRKVRTPPALFESNWVVVADNVCPGKPEGLVQQKHTALRQAQGLLRAKSRSKGEIVR